MFMWRFSFSHREYHAFALHLHITLTSPSSYHPHLILLAPSRSVLAGDQATNRHRGLWGFRHEVTIVVLLRLKARPEQSREAHFLEFCKLQHPRLIGQLVRDLLTQTYDNIIVIRVIRVMSKASQHELWYKVFPLESEYGHCRHVKEQVRSLSQCAIWRWDPENGCGKIELRHRPFQMLRAAKTWLPQLQPVWLLASHRNYTN